jgi:nucleoside-triphosphatase
MSLNETTGENKLMGKAYLLTGEPRVGKTTALKQVVASIGIKNCGGFITEEICIEGERVGFRIATLDGQGGMLAHVSMHSPYKVDRYGVSLQTLELCGVPAIHHALSFKSYVIIDEIGPMQMLSAHFQQAVLDTLKSSIPLLGTVSESNAWLSELTEYADIELYPLTEGNRDDVPQILIKALQENRPV